MYRYSTKSRGEVEDAEADRLIKPLPRYKPPRHDRERNQEAPDKDPDLDGSDPDLSMNYKTIGGNLLKIAIEFPTEEALRSYLKAHPDADPKKHSVKKQEKGKPAESDSSEETGKPLPPDAPATPEPGKKPKAEPEKKAPSKKSPEDSQETKPEPEVEIDPEDTAAAEHWRSKPPEEVAQFKKLLSGLPKDMKISDIIKGLGDDGPEVEKTIGKNVETVEDLASWLSKVLLSKGKGKKKPKDKKLKDKDESEDGSEDISSKPSKPSTPEGAPELELDEGGEPPEKPPGKPEAPEKPGKPEAPEKVPDVPDLEPGKDKPKEEGEPVEDKPEPEPSAAAKHGLPEPVRPEPTTEAVAAANAVIKDQLPGPIGTEVSKLNLHPDDKIKVVSTFNQLKGVKFDPAQMAGKYEVDPDHVKPPTKWPDPATGELVDFGSLPDDVKAEAYRQHQVQVVAMSLAAEHNLAEKLSNKTLLGRTPRVPYDVTRVLANMSLRGSSDDPSKTNKVADAMFKSTIDNIRKNKGMDKTLSEVDDSTVKTLLQQLPPHAKPVAAAYFQAVDLYKANTKVNVLSQSAKSIAKSVQKQRKWFESRAKLYGGSSQARGYDQFRQQILARVQAKSPKKYAETKQLLAKDEAQSYEAAHAQWKKDLAKWQKKKDTAESGGSFRGTPEEFNETPPVEPTAPASYVEHATGKEDLKVKQKQLVDNIFQRFAHFTYAAGGVMKSATYHGIEPQYYRHGESEEIPRRGLTDSDKSTLISEAKKLLKTSPMCEEGPEPERVALDLAITAGPQNGRVDAPTYGELLARLKGNKVSFVNGSKGMKKLSAQHEELANQMLAALDRTANTIHQHYEAFGLSEADARTLLASIDSVSDSLEAKAFGQDSLNARKASAIELLKQGKVLQKDSDEKYMATFQSPMKVHQRDADEKYMDLYNDDQTSAVAGAAGH